MFQDCLILRHKKRQKCSRESGVGGARNPDLRITHARSVAHASIAYKYDTLTDCAWWYEECFLSTKLANWNQNSPDGTKTVRDQCYYPRKMKQQKRANQEEWLLPSFSLFRITTKRQILVRPVKVDHFKKQFRIFWSEETETNLFIWLPTEIFGIFGMI